MRETNDVVDTMSETNDDDISIESDNSLLDDVLPAIDTQASIYRKAKLSTKLKVGKSALQQLFQQTILLSIKQDKVRAGLIRSDETCDGLCNIVLGKIASHEQFIPYNDMDLHLVQLFFENRVAILISLHRFLSELFTLKAMDQHVIHGIYLQVTEELSDCLADLALLLGSPIPQLKESPIHHNLIELYAGGSSEYSNKFFEKQQSRKLSAVIAKFVVEMKELYPMEQYESLLTLNVTVTVDEEASQCVRKFVMFFWIYAVISFSLKNLLSNIAFIVIFNFLS
jgi:hypothetical protein